MGAPDFMKMHGLGNDFVVLDARRTPIEVPAARARALADRRRGIGCDQVIVLEPPQDAAADLFMRIYNADGSQAGACGNATRCIAAMVMDETGRDVAVVQTLAGLLQTRDAGGGRVAVDMGPVRTEWHEIPLAEAADTLHLKIGAGALQDPVAVNVGNPHAVFFVDDADAVPLETLGPELEVAPLYPERTNVEAATVLTPERMRLRVWERGAGLTLASGSCACAALVAAHRRGLTGRRAEVVLDGGVLEIEWRDDNHVIQTGPWSESFRGRVADALWDADEEAAA